MSISTKRRTLLKGTMGMGSVGLAAAAGLLTPQAVLAAWNEAAFKSKSIDSAIGGAAAHSDKIKIKAPDIAENGAVVPVTITSDISGTESISILAEKNSTPLAAEFILGAGAESTVSTRIKMGKTGAVVGVVKAGGKLYANRKEVKVTIGGCGG
ncbi:MAG: thiosulfate oxidation carrier protein SoxY [gamma proteobacterium symbiont of Bathyaustriella thionipta]|nr:thiosulfate oxidation carrier protein SoxY [gamma proteobacterium symbiont of Bathyaustriella thionipta]